MCKLLFSFTKTQFVCLPFSQWKKKDVHLSPFWIISAFCFVLRPTWYFLFVWQTEDNSLKKKKKNRIFFGRFFFFCIRQNCIFWTQFFGERVWFLNFKMWNFFLFPPPPPPIHWPQTEKKYPKKGRIFFIFRNFSLQSLVTFWWQKTFFLLPKSD